MKDMIIDTINIKPLFWCWFDLISLPYPGQIQLFKSRRRRSMSSISSFERKTNGRWWIKVRYQIKEDKIKRREESDGRNGQSSLLSRLSLVLDSFLFFFISYFFFFYPHLLNSITLFYSFFMGWNQLIKLSDGTTCPGFTHSNVSSFIYIYLLLCIYLYPLLHCYWYWDWCGQKFGSSLFFILIDKSFLSLSHTSKSKDWALTFHVL